MRGAAGRGGAVQIALGVEHDAASGGITVGSALKTVENFFFARIAVIGPAE
jgi:hypothetical protein